MNYCSSYAIQKNTFSGQLCVTCQNTKKSTGEDNDESGGQEENEEKKPLSDEFSEKTNQLLEYIEKTYLQGVIEDDPQGKNIIEKMKLDNSQKVGYIRQQKCIVFNLFSKGQGNGNWI